ncbi:hypothetical protein V1504DRAFT_464006 [Lipomyces starkeyi]
MALLFSTKTIVRHFDLSVVFVITFILARAFATDIVYNIHTLRNGTIIYAPDRESLNRMIGNYTFTRQAFYNWTIVDNDRESRGLRRLYSETLQPGHSGPPEEDVPRMWAQQRRAVEQHRRMVEQHRIVGNTSTAIDLDAETTNSRALNPAFFHPGRQTDSISSRI